MVAPRNPVAYRHPYALPPSISNPATSFYVSSSSTHADQSSFGRSENACGLKDESQISVSLDRQPLGGSLDGMNNRPTLGGQADGELPTNDQSYLDSDQDSVQAFSSAQFAAADSDQHNGWGSFPPLANSDPYVQGSQYAQSLAAAAAAAPAFNGAAITAPDSNIETKDDFTDWRVIT